MTNDVKQRAGMATREKYGHDFYVAIGKRGGRPRALTLAEIRANRVNKLKEKEIKLNKGQVNYSTRQLQQAWLAKCELLNMGGVAANTELNIEVALS